MEHRRNATATSTIEAPAHQQPAEHDGPPLRKLRHIPALDGLRGVAVVGVLLFHADHLTGGYLGVDLFFVLSGYLITLLLVLEWASTGTIAFRNFWVRRFRRLLPAMLAVLVAVGIASHWLVQPVSRGQLRGEGLATLAYVANWFAVFETDGYWDHTLEPSWLQHTWSLAIEEQFYVVWPLVVALAFGLWARRRSREPSVPDPLEVDTKVRRLGYAAWLAAAVSGGWLVYLAVTGTSQERLYLGTDTRMAAILLGAGLACHRFRAGLDLAPKPATRRLIALAGVGASLFLAVAWLRLWGEGELLYRGGLLAAGVAATVVLLDITTPGRSFIQGVLEAEPLQWFGRISYGLYLWHWPIFQYLRPGRHGLEGLEVDVARFGVTFVVAIASYHLLEQPIRRGALRGARAAVATPVALVVTVAAIVLGTTGAVDPEPVLSAPAVYVGPEDAPRVMVAGDSVADLLATDAFVPLADELGMQVINRGAIGCLLTRDVGDPDGVVNNCSHRWPEQVEQDQPDVVLLVLALWTGGKTVEEGGREYYPCSPQYDGRWRERLTDAIDVLSSTGAEVVATNAPLPPDPVYKEGNPPLFDARQQCTNDVMAEVVEAHPKARLVDLAGYVCPSADRCRLEIDGVELRTDGIHFREEAAEIIARWLAPEVLAAAEEDDGADPVTGDDPAADLGATEGEPAGGDPAEAPPTPGATDPAPGQPAPASAPAPPPAPAPAPTPAPVPAPVG